MSADREKQRDALVERLFEANLAAYDLGAIYLGDRLGLYAALAEAGPFNSADLADRTGTHERYAREWLEQQAVTGILTVDDARAAAESRRYALPEGHAEVLLARDSLSFLAPVGRFTIGVLSGLPKLLEAFRTGAGVAYPDYGADAREGQADANRPLFLNLLATVWLPAVADVHARLCADPPARVADVGCGTGWSSIALARGYPRARVEGFDLDEPSITLARRNAEAEGLGTRVAFEVRDAASKSLKGAYDLVTIFEALHDMPRPVEALRTAREMLAPGGTLIIADERVQEAFSAPNPSERLFYSWSLLFCLPTGLADPPSVGTGAVMRPGTLERYARDAGFGRVEVLPVEHDLWRFYRLHP